MWLQLRCLHGGARETLEGLISGHRDKLWAEEGTGKVPGKEAWSSREPCLYLPSAVMGRLQSMSSTALSGREFGLRAGRRKSGQDTKAFGHTEELGFPLKGGWGSHSSED